MQEDEDLASLDGERAARALERLPSRIRAGVWRVEFAEVVTVVGRGDARR
jgi:hypothetical protein